MKYKLSFLTIFFIVSCLYNTENQANAETLRINTKQLNPVEEYNVSIVKLIANPEKYDGKRIQVIGYLNVEFEGDAIYLHREDYEQGLTRNGFWVDFSNKITKEKKLSDYSKKYVIIAGKFDMKSHGHMSLFGGTIKEISRLDAWR